jgi:predicted lipoprotein with Yx(FWY)xxD motif
MPGEASEDVKMPFRETDMTRRPSDRGRRSHRRPKRRRALDRVFGAVALVMAVGLLGCGSAAPSPKSSTVPTATRAAAPAPATTAARAPVPSSRPGATVKVGRTRYGGVLLDGRGRALYLFTSDRNPRSRCYGACATSWPPFLTPGKPVAGAAAQARLLGTTRRNDGSTQVTYRGHPLYYYVGDRHAGEVLCQDVEEFGGRWYVLTRGGSAVL